MAIGWSQNMLDARLQAFSNKLDDAAGQGRLKVYTSPKPATGGAVGGATLLFTAIFPNPSMDNTTGAVLTLFNPPPLYTVADGVALWARFTTQAGVFIADCDCTVTAGTGPVKLSSLTIYNGGLVTITLGTLTDI